MRTYRFYIGAPNHTGTITPAYLDEIRAWARLNLGPFTLFQGQRYWQSASENVAVVEWITNEEPSKSLWEAVDRLKDRLDQKAILVTWSETYREVR